MIPPKVGKTTIFKIDDINAWLADIKKVKGVHIWYKENYMHMKDHYNYDSYCVWNPKEIYSYNFNFYNNGKPTIVIKYFFKNSLKKLRHLQWKKYKDIYCG